MTLRPVIGMILVLTLMDLRNVQGERFGKRPRLHIILLVHDLVGIDAETRLTAKAQIIRILSDAGVNIAWADPDGRWGLRTMDATVIYFTVVIASLPLPNWTNTDALGATVQTGPSSFAYVFYDQVQTFVRSFEPGSQKTPVGVMLGHAMAHELGHLLIPGEPHGKGIMRAQWTSVEWREAMRGLLLFHRDHAIHIQDALQPR